jgi:hypothetical protein
MNPKWTHGDQVSRLLPSYFHCHRTQWSQHLYEIKLVTYARPATDAIWKILKAWNAPKNSHQRPLQQRKKCSLTFLLNVVEGTD